MGWSPGISFCSSGVGASDIGEIPVAIAARHIAGAVNASRKRPHLPIFILIALHQTRGRWLDDDANLAFKRLIPRGVEQSDAIARERPPHRAGFELLTRRVADLRRRLRLPVAVADRQPPGRLDASDHLGIERFAGGAQKVVTPRCAMASQIDGERAQLTEFADGREREGVAQKIVEHLRLSRWLWRRETNEVGRRLADACHTTHRSANLLAA